MQNKNRAPLGALFVESANDAMKRKKAALGFTLIELLIVVVIIGILAAIAIPNLLQALQKSKQKRTMADIRNIAAAWEAYHVDQSSFVAAGAAATPGTQLDWPSGDELTHAEVQERLSPTYLRTIPRLDGWGTPFEFAASTEHFFIRSYGKDFQPDGSSYTARETTVFSCDIVYSDGSFFVYPVGTQQSGT